MKLPIIYKLGGLEYELKRRSGSGRIRLSAGYARSTMHAIPATYFCYTIIISPACCVWRVRNVRYVKKCNADCILINSSGPIEVNEGGGIRKCQ